jgi:predicted DNA-binding transcriptional regulator AlpA
MKSSPRRRNAPKSNDALLDADAATRLLGVSRNTLYAYVSRGLVRATSNPQNPKASLYAAADLHAPSLTGRRGCGARGQQPQPLSISAWPVLKTRLTHFEDGHLFYRTIDAIELSRTASLEDAARLIWNTGGFDPFVGQSFDTASIRGMERGCPPVRRRTGHGPGRGSPPAYAHGKPLCRTGGADCLPRRRPPAARRYRCLHRHPGRSQAPCTRPSHAIWVSHATQKTSAAP